MKNERKVPPLGAGSIDLDVLHAADKKGHDPTEALEKARTLGTAPVNAPASAAQAAPTEPAKPASE